MFHYKKNRIWPFLLALFCSLLLNLLLFFSPTIFFKNSSKGLFSQTETNEDDFIQVEYPIHRQVVSQQQFNKITPKKQTYYLSQADKTVEKETQAMLKGLFYQASQQSMNHHAKSPDFPKFVKRETSSIQPAFVDKVTKPISIDLSLEQAGAFRETNNQQLSRTMDFLPGVELGSHTLLNSREFIYYSYFARMKEQLYWRWTQYIKKELLERPSSINQFVNEYKKRYFATRLYVYLSPEGEVQDMRVVQSSGAEDIDSAALHAFLLAEPFPNPPKGLIEEDGHIHIKQTFHLSIGSYAPANLFSRQN